MTQWYVKDLSKLTEISVQTLHHYDRIGLLKPSIRLSNGYRVYSEQDLLQLQRIIALKFFGFELSQIKKLLTNNIGILEHFVAQAKLLEQKANTLLDASNSLKSIISNVTDDKSIPWITIIKLIEVYRMTQKLEHSWVKQILTPEELKQFVAFEAELKTNFTLEQKTSFERDWANLVAEIKSNIYNDPSSAIGITLGKKWMTLINGLYGKKHAHLRTKIFEKGFGDGVGLKEHNLTPEVVSWAEKAIEAYYKDRIRGILDQVGKISSDQVLNLWNDVLDDLYGNEADHKKQIYTMVFNDQKVSDEAKKWLQSISKHQ